MSVKRFDTIGAAPMQVSEDGHFVLYSDYQPAAAYLQFDRVPHRWPEGFDADHFYQADTPFLTRYEITFNHPGFDELECIDGVYVNIDELTAKYPDADAANKKSPYWLACYVGGPECNEHVILGIGTCWDAVKLCQQDFIERIAECWNAPVSGQAVQPIERVIVAP